MKKNNETEKEQLRTFIGLIWLYIKNKEEICFSIKFNRENVYNAFHFIPKRGYIKLTTTHYVMHCTFFSVYSFNEKKQKLRANRIVKIFNVLNAMYPNLINDFNTQLSKNILDKI